MYLKHLTIVVLEEICIHGFPRENVFEFAAQQVLRFQQRREELKPKEKDPKKSKPQKKSL